MVRVRREGRALVATLDRPDKHNAYDGQALKDLAAAWAELDADPKLRVGILTGAGDRAFCAGADLNALAGGGFEEGPFPDVARNLAAKPLIAAVNGLCLGGGMMLAAGCDVRIAEEHAIFSLPEAHWNLPMHWIGALARQMLPAHVLEVSLWADATFSSRRMYEMGWVNRVVPRGASLAEARRWAERVAAHGPRAVRLTKDLVLQSPAMSPEESFSLGLAYSEQLRVMEDSREGPRAFLEGRSPDYLDR